MATALHNRQPNGTLTRWVRFSGNSSNARLIPKRYCKAWCNIWSNEDDGVTNWANLAAWVSPTWIENEFASAAPS